MEYEAEQAILDESVYREKVKDRFMAHRISAGKWSEIVYDWSGSVVGGYVRTYDGVFKGYVHQ